MLMLRWRNSLIRGYKRDEAASRAVSTCAELGPPTILIPRRHAFIELPASHDP